MTPGPIIEPGTHWWEASALTTAPTLLPKPLTRVFKNCVYLPIVFSLLVVDCQLEILEFLVIYIDVIDWRRNARSLWKT